MKLSHILYKVNNLNESVNDFKNQGFHVEYGSKYHPHNAIIYFSEGPYIELIEKAPISLFLKFILKIIGKSKLVDRFNSWDTSKQGFFEICLENHRKHFKHEIDILNKYKQAFFITNSKRLDPYDRLLKWRLLFPMEIKIPFIMTYFNIDPKPKNYMHPNGIKGIEHVVYGTDKDLIPIINEICNDNSLSIEKGKGVKRVIFKR